MKAKRLLLLLATFACMLCMAQSAFSAPLFKRGDRVVIYGDSITEQQMYSRYVQLYLQCRYPELKLRFFNAGWGGDTASGALNRWERDVLIHKPDVVTLFFGMNDGAYTLFDQSIVTRYRNNMEKLIKAIQAKKIRVVVFTPSCVDYDRNEGLKNVKYNEMLEALGTNAIELAKQYNCAYYDVFHPMLKVQADQKSANPQFTMIPDSVHPNPAGHLTIAYSMLKGLGAEAVPAIGSIDVNTGAANNLKVISQNPSKLVFKTIKPVLAPFWFTGEAEKVVKDSGFINMISAPFKVTGLSGTYKLAIDGETVGTYTSGQLAEGIKVSGSYSERGKMIHDVINHKESSYFHLWRNTRLPLINMPTLDKVVNAGMALDKSLHESALELAAPKTATITLEKQ